MRTLAAVFVAAFLATSLTGCSDPCTSFNGKADPAAQELTDKGYEVEREVNGTDCELQPDGSWSTDS